VTFTLSRQEMDPLYPTAPTAQACNVPIHLEFISQLLITHTNSMVLWPDLLKNPTKIPKFSLRFS